MMNIMHKSLSIAFLAVSIYISGLTAEPVIAQSSVTEPMITLTAEEQAWLAAHQDIALGAPTSFPPFLIQRNDGTHVGVLVDYLEAVSRLLNHRIRLHIEDPWIKVQERAEAKEIAGLAMGGKAPHRAVHFSATDTVLNTYYSAFARSKDEYQIKQFSDLDGMRIGYREGGHPAINMLKKLPSADLKPYGSNEALTQALLSREIDIIVAWVSYDFFRKNKLLGTINNILVIEEHPVEMVAHIRKDWPELVSIMNKVIVVMQQDALPRIMNKWFVDWPKELKGPSFHLTPKEKAWLDQNHTVRIRIADIPPYQIIKSNEAPQGIVIEYLELIEKRTGIEFKHEVTDQPFAEFLESMKQRQGPDMTAVIVPTPAREQYLSFSEPYIYSPYVIFMREQDKPILDISGLAGKTLAVPRGFVVQEQLGRDYPEIRLALFDSDEKALKAVTTGQADAYIGNLTTASHIIHERGFTTLKVAAAGPFGDQVLAMGIRKDWPELTSIIDKSLASITEEEKTAIRNKYLAIKFEEGINKAVLLKWVLIAGGAASGIVLIFVFWNRQLSREISRRMQTELALRQAKYEAETANQAKSIFLANMSHELRTPLNAILGFSRMLAREQNTTAKQHEKLNIINRSGQHLLSMINDVLDLSKIEAGRVELQEDPFDLVALIKEISAMNQSRATEKGLYVAVEAEAISVPYVKADVGKLRQILINLLNNAVKFTNEGGVTIRCATVVPIPGEPTRCHIVIEVEDSGPGIEPARQAQIFEPFVMGIDEHVRKGTGLGLSISRKFAELMGGTIEVKSELGKGALFRVRLPAGIAEAAHVRTSVEDKPRVIGLAPSQRTWRVLVADDNRENLLLLKSLLESVGFFVLEAKNGKEALAAFKKEAPDFIWMDMRMPVMDGYEAVRQIRQCPEGDTIPIIAITASAFGEQRQEILEAGCDEVVYKPFRDHEIFETMARLLDIQYRYAEEVEETTRKERIKLTAEMLVDIPAELLRELRTTTLVANREAALDVIARIAERAPEVAAGLKELVDTYRMVELRDMLDEVE